MCTISASPINNTSQTCYLGGNGTCWNNQYSFRSKYLPLQMFCNHCSETLQIISKSFKNCSKIPEYSQKIRNDIFLPLKHALVLIFRYLAYRASLEVAFLLLCSEQSQIDDYQNKFPKDPQGTIVFTRVLQGSSWFLRVDRVP